MEIVELALRPGSPLIGVRLSELHKVIKLKVLVCAVERGSQVFIPDGSFQLEEGDRLSVTASAGDLARLIRGLGIQQKKVRDVMIVGGSRIAIYLAMELLNTGVDVKLIEIDEERCELLADVLPKATVIHADGSNRYVLDSEGLARTDAVVTLTDMDEENLIISMYANYLGTCKVITKINRTDFTEVLSDKGIDCVVSPQGAVLQRHRPVCAGHGQPEGRVGHHPAPHRGGPGGGVGVPGRAAALQLGKRLADVRLKPNTLIACINRRGKMILPKAATPSRPRTR